MATYKELRDAVAARVEKLNWTAYETVHLLNVNAIQ